MGKSFRNFLTAFLLPFWENIDGLKILKEKVDSVNFPIGENENYEDVSNKTLQNLGGLLEDEEGDDDDVDVDI